MSIETHILDIIKGKKSAPVTKILLHAMSQCYRAGIRIRHFAYDSFISPAKLSSMVISVGNIVAGGTGKTPFIQYLAETLNEKKVAILSRGYRRRSRKSVVVTNATSAEECGDEPFMLAQKLPQVSVIVGSKRTLSGRQAEELKAEIVLLDDGMQHRQLHRDIEIGVMDAGDLFGKGYYLPRGLLREDPRRLAKVDLIILNGVKDQVHFEGLTTRIRRYSQAPITAMSIAVENRIDLASKKVGAVCAIAAPERFMDTLKGLGCDIVLRDEKPDHFAFNQDELEVLANQAFNQGAECLVCTEKDAVKFPKKLSLRLPLIPVKIVLKPSFGKEHLEKIIREVKNESRF